jgi:hypothetical protein
VICSPDETEVCYSGPEETRGVGTCEDGVQTCGPDGTSWGACEGEVLPAQETCAGTADENCDGFDCGIWAKLIAESDAESHATAVGAGGEVFVTGSFGGSAAQALTMPMQSASIRSGVSCSPVRCQPARPSETCPR